MKTLIVLAHQDDEVLSCGGLIQKRLESQGEVRVVIVFSRIYTYGKGDQYFVEQFDSFLGACKVLGITDYYCYNCDEKNKYNEYYSHLEFIEKELSVFKPDEVVVHSREDLHQSHRWLSDIFRVVLRAANLGGVSRVLASHGIDSATHSSINWFEVLTELHLGKKLKAMRCYERESRRMPHQRAPENLVALHQVIGSRCGNIFAEPYTLLLNKG